MIIRRWRVLVPVVLTSMVVGTGIAGAVISDTPAQTWGVNGRVMTILPVGDQVFLGGSFTAVVDPAGTTYPAANLAVISASTGAADLSWQGGTDGIVNGLAHLNGQLFVGGNFSAANGQSRADLAAMSVSTGALLPWKVSSNATVDALTVAGSSLYAAGNFTTIKPAGSVAQTRAYVARLGTTTGTLDTAWAPTPDARVRSLATSSNGATVFLGGDFTSVGGASGTNKIAALSATTGARVSGFVASANNGTSFGVVYGLSTDGTNLYQAVGGSGGACTAVSATTGARVWSKHGNGNLHGVRRVGNTVYCGGHFSGTASFDGQDRSKVAAVDAITYATLPFAPTVNSALGVWALSSSATSLLMGGDFTKAGGVEVRRYAQFVDSAAQTVPGAPVLTATAGNGVVNLSWTPPASDGGSAITKYIVSRTDVGRLATETVPTTTYADTSVTNGTSYTYKIRAVNDIGAGSYSNSVTVTPTP